MASETYYFVFSVLAVLLMITHGVNLVYLKKSGMTLMGEKLKKSSIGYKKFQTFYSSWGIAATAVLTLLAIGNLFYDIHRIVNFEDTEYARGLLFYYPPGILILLIILILVTRTRLNQDDRR